MKQCAPVLPVCASGEQTLHLLDNFKSRISFGRIHQTLTENVVPALPSCFPNPANIGRKVRSDSGFAEQNPEISKTATTV